MATTVLVEPDPGGHRFQSVAHVARVAKRTGDVMLLTSAGATADPAFAIHLGEMGLHVEERFDAIYPTTRSLAETVADVCRTRNVSTVVVMDADQSLKRWWYAAPRAFRGGRRPRVVFMLTRYPAKLGVTDRVGWMLRVSKSTLAVAAMVTGSLHRAAGYAGRDDMTRGWIVRRTRDPDICSAHSRDQKLLREGLGLPTDRVLIGIFGVISERKNSPLIWSALDCRSIEADLLLGGQLSPEVAAWVATLTPVPRGRVIVREGFLSNEMLDQLVAAVDVILIADGNNGPSGIMGKALAAGVPVVSAGSQVRARELIATDAGELAARNAESIGEAIQRVLDRDPLVGRRNTVPPATADEFAENLLGVGERRRRRTRRAR